eukprot:CAMPEP_0197637002 /NCGR_PEP_ID=MMETSP1338-20131121/12355_1 /TAXON_ID=43686 ORGANISM="Pelagodinium beii, Strain RCC1491" /NCGR_SAMPLE_ID=MMETSP1338 /ASSEMBLY_ACC=CAM_ASM_000754 /LENGTH=56 /DNA_ID=CAMNT_0043209351 /DNA_START=20 /DNA_END=186 /DNA_ORIENTATION=+
MPQHRERDQATSAVQGRGADNRFGSEETAEPAKSDGSEENAEPAIDMGNPSYAEMP